MPNLSMSRTAVQTRRDLARALRDRGWTIDEIGRECGYVDADGNVNRSSVRSAISQGQPNRAARRAARVTNRRFGIEIECFGIRPSVAAQALRDAGLQAADEGYSHQTRTYWKVITDASVNGSGTGMGSGLEVVSPPLSGPDGFDQVVKAMKALRDAGAQVDSTCGLHVHHEVTDLTPSSLAAFITAYIDNQSVIDYFVAPSRRASRGNRWCSGISGYEKDEILRRVAQVNSHGRDVLGRFDRYRTLNVTSYPKYGTIEIRQHQGSLAGRKAVGWIKFGQALIAAAVAADTADDATTVVADDAAGLIAILTAQGGLETADAEYLTRRVETLNTPIDREAVRLAEAAAEAAQAAVEDLRDDLQYA